MNIGKFAHAALWEIPGLLIQIGIITSLMVITYGVASQSLIAGVVSLIWLKVTQDDAVQDFMKIRAQKALFIKAGKWVDREDAAQAFDDTYAKHLAFHNGIDDENYTAVAYAKGTINGLRQLVATILSIYLILVIALEIL